VLAGISTIFVAIGYWKSPPGIASHWALLNRSIGVAMLWLTAVLLVKRKTAELALKENERRLRAIFDHAPVAIFVKDQTGRYVEFSRQCELDTGKSRRDVIGKTDKELFPENMREIFVATDQEAIKAGHAVQKMIGIPGGNGVRMNLVVIKFPLFDSDGRITAVAGIAADVTDLKQAEQLVREHQERLNLAQVAANMGTFEHILDGGVLHWSPAMEQLYGLAVGSFDGHYESWLRMVHPEDRARVELEQARALCGKEEFKTEHRIIRPDGTVRWIKSMSKIFCDDSGKPERLVGISMDITDQKKAQEAITFSNERLGLIAQVTAAVVASRPLPQEMHKLAEQVMRAFGFDACVIRTLQKDKLELLASAGILDANLQYALPANTEVFQTLAASRNALFIPNAMEHPDIRRFLAQMSPEYRFLSYAGAPLLVHDQMVGILGIYSKKTVPSFSETDLGHLQIVANHIAVAIVNDRLFEEVQRQTDQLAQQVREREQTEEALKQTTEQLQTLSRRLLEMQEAERRHIARELHDEIGQALTTLKINLQAVHRIPDVHHASPRLVDSIAIVDRTLRQVRNLSLDLRPSMLDDLGLSAALRWYADRQAQRAGLRIQFHAHGVEDTRLAPGLETSCFRIAQEALTNIVRHAHAASVKVELSQTDGFLHLTVHDDGVGFDLEKARSQLQDGASLGLLGMEERASLAGGRIDLKSAPQKGTEVHVWFPLAHSGPDGLPAIKLAEK
jgi:PAS domain S-box-containing protein